MVYDRSNPYEFTSLVRELEGPGLYSFVLLFYVLECLFVVCVLVFLVFVVFCLCCFYMLSPTPVYAFPCVTRNTRTIEFFLIFLFFVLCLCCSFVCLFVSVFCWISCLVVRCLFLFVCVFVLLPRVFMSVCCVVCLLFAVCRV